MLKSWSKKDFKSYGKDELKTVIRKRSKKLFGYKPKAFQMAIIKRIIKGKHALCVLPTGYGKSAIFQIPISLLNGTAIIFSPLIALMKDQAQRMNDAGIPCARITSENTEAENKNIQKNLSKYKAIFVAPERLSNKSFLQACQSLKVSMVVVDEMHCHPKGTRVNTPNGYTPIEQLKEGDIVLSYDGNDYVRRKVMTCFHKTVKSTEVLDIQTNTGKRFQITKDHPVFVRNMGYIPAGSLSVGDVLMEGDYVRNEKDAGLFTLSERVPISEEERSRFREVLFTEVLSHEFPRITNVYRLLKEIRDQEIIKSDSLRDSLWVNYDGKIFVGTNEAKKSNALAKELCEAIEEVERNRPLSSCPWRERGEDALSTENVMGFISFDGTGTLNSHWYEDRRTGLACFRRLSIAEREDRYRGGRAEPSIKETGLMGSRAGFSDEATRVESITCYEQGDTGGHTSGEDESVEVFSLHVEHEHNYCVEGILVHNCISAWKQSFRPSYALIEDFIRQIVPKVPRLGLTATADQDVFDDCVLTLALKGKKFYTKLASPYRENLEFKAVQNLTNFQLSQAVTKSAGTKIIYCYSRKNTEKLTDELRRAGTRVEFYHAGMSMADRTRVQDGFMNGKYTAIVATSAFGMGIDRADIRLIVNYDVPPTIFDMLQTVGRAGRDGKKSICILNYTKRSFASQKYILSMNNPPQWVYQKIWRHLSKFAKVGEVLKIDERKMNKYLGMQNDYWISSALRYMEYTKNIKISPGMAIYTLKIRNPPLAKATARNTEGVSISRDSRDLIVRCSHNDSGIVDELVRRGAVFFSHPSIESFLKRRHESLSITDRMVSAKHNKDIKKLNEVVGFINAPNKKEFIDKVFTLSV